MLIDEMTKKSIAMKSITDTAYCFFGIQALLRLSSTNPALDGLGGKDNAIQGEIVSLKFVSQSHSGITHSNSSGLYCQMDILICSSVSPMGAGGDR